MPRRSPAVWIPYRLLPLVLRSSTTPKAKFDPKTWTDGDMSSGAIERRPRCAARPENSQRPEGRPWYYSDSAAKAASRTCSTGPTPEILRYFGAPGRPDCAHLL